jgi:hypothetical protein
VSDRYKEGLSVDIELLSTAHSTHTTSTILRVPANYRTFTKHFNTTYLPTSTTTSKMVCCGRNNGTCVCAQEAKCSCGKQPALQCSMSPLPPSPSHLLPTYRLLHVLTKLSACEKAVSENKLPEDSSACACGKRTESMWYPRPVCY